MLLLDPIQLNKNFFNLLNFFQIQNLLSAISWNYAHMFIVCISYYLVSVLDQINQKILSHERQVTNYIKLLFYLFNCLREQSATGYDIYLLLLPRPRSLTSSYPSHPCYFFIMYEGSPHHRYILLHGQN